MSDSPERDSEINNLLEKAMSFSFYLNYAATVTDPVERMRAVITSTIAFLWKNSSFEKPLNPVLGETY